MISSQASIRRQKVFKPTKQMSERKPQFLLAALLSQFLCSDCHTAQLLLQLGDHIGRSVCLN